MEYLSNKNGFLGIDNKFNFKEKVVIVPFGLEKTVSYGGGTKNGPREIIKASHQVELYDEELHCEPYKKIGIKTLKPFKINRNIKKALKKMSDINREILNKIFHFLKYFLFQMKLPIRFYDLDTSSLQMHVKIFHHYNFLLNLHVHQNVIDKFFCIFSQKDLCTLVLLNVLLQKS